jgi:hypothetical protein
MRKMHIFYHYAQLQLFLLWWRPALFIVQFASFSSAEREQMLIIENFLIQNPKAINNFRINVFDAQIFLVILLCCFVSKNCTKNRKRWVKGEVYTIMKNTQRWMKVKWKWWNHEKLKKCWDVIPFCCLEAWRTDLERGRPRLLLGFQTAN